MSRGSIFAGRAVILVTAEDQLNRGLGKVRSTLRKFANTLSNIGDSSLRGGLLGSIVSGGILRHFVDFDDKLLTLQAKLGIFGKAVGQDAVVMKDLEESIRALGKSTSYTTSQVTDAAISLAQAGFSADKIKGSLQAVLDLGRGTGYGLDQSAEVLANTMATFNLEAKAATLVADQLVRATRLGTVEIDDLRESLKYASGAVSNLNEDLPVLLSLLVQMSEAGLKGSLAGTSLNTALNQMVKNAEQLKALYGVDIITSVGSNGQLKIDLMKSFINIAKQLQAIPDPGKRLAAYNDIFNLRGQRAVTSVREMEQVVQILQKLTEASGEARRAAQTMDMRLGGSLRRATGAVSDFVLTLGQINAPLVTSFLEAVPAAAQALQYFAKAHGDLMIALVLSPFALVAVGVALKGLAITMTLAASSLTPLISGLRALSSVVLPGTSRQLSFLFGTKKAPGIFKGAGALGAKGTNFLHSLYSRMKSTKEQVSERSRLRALAAGQAALARSQFKKMALLGDKGARLGGFLGNERAVQTKLGVDIDNIDKKLVHLAKARQIAADAARVEAMYQKDLTRLLAEEVTLTQRINDASNRTKPGSALSSEALLALEEKRTTIEYQRWRIEKERQKLRVRSPESSAALFREQNRLLTERAIKVNRIARMETAINRTAIQQGKIALKARGLGSQAITSKSRAENLLKSANSIRPITELFRGVRLVKGIDNLLSFGKALFTVANGVRRFVFSVGGITTILELLLLFGDKLPGVKDAMQAFSNGFKAAGEQIGKIRGILGPGMALFSQGIETLNAGEVEAGLSLLQTGVQSLIGVIGNQLSAAWFAFMEKVSWVYDIFKKIVVVSYEIGAAIAGSVGVALDNIFGRLGRLFGGEMVAGDGISALIATVAKFTAAVVPALTAFLLKFESILAQFILNLMEAFPMLTKFSADGAKQKLASTVLANEASVAALMNIMKKAFANIDTAMFLPSEMDFKRRRLEAERAGKQAQDILKNTDLKSMFSSYFSTLTSNLSNLLSSTTSKKEELKDAFLDDFFNGLDNMQKSKNGMQQSTPPDLAKALNIVSAFVGSAQASRGNLLQAINVEKQTQKEIQKNTQRAADELEDINARGGQLVFTS